MSRIQQPSPQQIAMLANMQQQRQQEELSGALHGLAFSIFAPLAVDAIKGYTSESTGGESNRMRILGERSLRAAIDMFNVLGVQAEYKPRQEPGKVVSDG